ncbi:MAG TPA: LON peptidase substrate-binding domain-containing protein [Planctomycetota bacterium]|nr:LON peptidase substrate-binding domain-containing protein [Planctomycetota bacterium]
MTEVDGGGRLAGTLEVPLFPLPSITLFPRVKLPFYIFEPRYRAMLAHVLDHDGLVGVPLLRPGGETAPNGAPAFAEVFGIGRVTDYETHDDGTSHIEVLGVARAALSEEIPSTPFRRARARILADVPAAPEDARSVRTDLAAGVARLEGLGMSPEARDALQTLFTQAGDDLEFLVNVMATVTVGQAAVRQHLLEEDRVFERARALATLLETLRQELDAPGRPRPAPPSGPADP